MRIKKLLALVLCTVLSLLALVSCEKDVGAYLPNYNWKPEVIAEKEFDLYIITDSDIETVDSSVFVTVEDKINQYIGDKYHTTLNIHYLTADEYETEIAAVTSAEGKNSGIVLINSKALADTLIANKALADLSVFLDSAEYDFGTLNVQINSNLLEVARETVKDADGENETEALFCIPNNHVIGSYEYIAINKKIARDQLHYNETELKALDNLDDIADFISYAASKGFEADDVVIRFEGEDSKPYSFAEKTELEAAGWIFNVIATPKVTKEEVYSSAFGVLAGTDGYERAMEIIYAINTDSVLRNLLQYGVENTNYKNVDGYAVPITTDYKMNILYTGDVFKALFSNTEGWCVWTATDAANGKLQNADSVVADSE